MPGSGPDLSFGRAVELPGRGRTWAYDSGPPAGRPHRPALLLLHGWTSTAALNWFRCFPILRREFRVIALDHRGHGRGIRSRRPFRLEDCADDAAALIEQFGTGPVTAVGYSMGGPIAQLLWRRHPEVVDSLVLCATAARFVSTDQRSTAFGVVGQGMALGLATVPAVVRQNGFRLLVRNRLADAGMSPWAIAEWERNDPAALVQAGLALGRYDAKSWIGSIDVPTAVVVTELDNVVSPRRQQFLVDNIPGAVRFGVAGDHRAVEEQATLFGPALIEACRTVQLAPRPLGAERRPLGPAPLPSPQSRSADPVGGWCAPPAPTPIPRPRPGHRRGPARSPRPPLFPVPRRSAPIPAAARPAPPPAPWRPSRDPSAGRRRPGRWCAGCGATRADTRHTLRVAGAHVQLGALAGAVAERRQHGPGRVDEGPIGPALGDSGQPHQPGAEHEAAALVAVDQAVVLEGGRQPMGRGPRQRRSPRPARPASTARPRGQSRMPTALSSTPTPLILTLTSRDTISECETWP